MRLFLVVCAGGAIGAGLRYLVNVGTVRWLGAGFPWGTIVVNLAGSFLMGVLIEALAHRLDATPELRLFVATGVLGSLTTFSTFSLDVAVLVQRGEHALAAAYLLASVALGILALFAGLHAGRGMFA